MAKRRDLFDPTDPASLQPEQRLDEVAAILASGVLRMRERRRAAAAPNVRSCRVRVRGTASSRDRAATCMPKIPPESGETRLELFRRSSPDGQSG